ncbi:hypothetical protein [Pseudoflavonifractor sp. An85]|uniref:hypothetical protein n=1 Tax=Pseudoflavonifractor sp. An85 TaxID=1965661 RepID=UPI000B36C45C|nr:hypothetical protein [Pseudoflavonifractor sp. An85]OUN24572.1 hypothetical protein B5G37_07220 [Pseudoflavonifractor sp. An85]
MAKQRLKKMVITVTPQTAYHLREMAGMCHYKSVGRVVDKLVREKRISMNEWKREGGAWKKNG